MGIPEKLAIENGQSRNGQHRVHKTKKKHNTIYDGHLYTQTNTNNVNTNRTSFYMEIVTDIQTRN
jgi:hypothetical protein